MILTKPITFMGPTSDTHHRRFKFRPKLGRAYSSLLPSRPECQIPFPQAATADKPSKRSRTARPAALPIQGDRAGNRCCSSRRSAPSPPTSIGACSAPLIANAFMVHTVIGIIRVTTSYRTIELEPAGRVAGRHLGRLCAAAGVLGGVARPLHRPRQRQPGGLDRRRADALSAVGFWAWSDRAAAAPAFTVVLGFGHMFCMASHQMLAVRCANMRGRESAFGHYMVAVSTGQGLGPFIVGWLGGSATVPATGYLFGIGAIAAVLCLAVALTLRPAPRPAAHASDGPVVRGRHAHSHARNGRRPDGERGDGHLARPADRLSAAGRAPSATWMRATSACCWRSDRWRRWWRGRSTPG